MHTDTSTGGLYGLRLRYMQQLLVYKNFEEGSKKRIVLNGYEFEEEVNDINPVPWICVRRHFSCTARFYERTDNVFEITTPIKHNHAPTYEDNLDLLSVSIVDIKRRSKIDSVIILADSDLDEDTEDEDDTEDDSEEDTDEEEPSPYPIRPIPGKEDKGNTEEEEESKKKEAKQRPSRPSRPSPYPIRPIPEKVVEDDTEEERKKKKARQRPSRPSPYPIRPLPEKEDEDDTKEKEERKKKETKQRPSRPSRPSPYSIPDKKTLLKNGNMKSRRSLLKKQPPNFDESLLELKKVTTIRKKRLH